MSDRHPHELDVWDAMLDADMNQRYWSRLVDRYSRRDFWAKVFLAVMSSGTVAAWAIWAQCPLAWRILSGASAIVAIVLPICKLPETVGRMANLRGHWTELLFAYEALWRKVRDDMTVNIEPDMKPLRDKEVEVTKQEAGLPRDEKLILECRNEVVASLRLTNG